MNSIRKSKRSFIKSVLLTAFIAGTLDAAAAVINYGIATGKNPIVIFPFIASGVFGKDAFTGAGVMIFWGFVFHYLIAFLFTLFFFVIYTRVNLLAKNIFVTAIIYGLFVWAVMNLVVVPLSNTPKSAFDWHRAVIAAVILIICIALPITIGARKYDQRI